MEPGYVFATLLLMVLGFFLGRGIVLWYFKVNVMVASLKEIAGHLSALRTETITGVSATPGGADRLAEARTVT